MNIDRYRTAERDLFADAGIDPIEHRIRVDGVNGTVRVLEVGQGAPVLFLHGGPNAAATWSYVAAAVAPAGLRCLLLDRPGCGLSDPPSEIPTSQTLPDYLPRLSIQVLDALRIEAATVVGSSLGGYAALRTATVARERVRSVCLAGCPAFIPGWTPPAFFAYLRRPVTRFLLLNAPLTQASVRRSLAMSGQRHSVEAGLVPPAMTAWIAAWQAHTRTLRNDTAMIVACGDKHGFDPNLELTTDDLTHVTQPVTALFGADDPVGGADTGQALAAALPNAHLTVLADTGHLPWLDHPTTIADSIITTTRAPA